MDIDPRRDVILTGIGGQGIQLCAKVLALAAAADDHHVMLSSYFAGEMRGGRTEATVVTRDEPIVGTAVPTVDELRAHLAARLVAPKHPRVVVAVEELPHTDATGQIRRGALRDAIRASYPES
jgi:acyl-CoA synthetase (AMP-forming)/AMP-acid ligase II